MASIALRHKSHHLNLKSHHTLFNFSRLYSSSSSNNDNGDNQPPKPSAFSSYFSQINAKSGQQQPPNSLQFDELRKNLSGFGGRSSPNNRNPNHNPNPNPIPNFPKGTILSFDKIKESLKRMPERRINVPKQSMWNTNTNTSSVIGGGSVTDLASVIFVKEIKEKERMKKKSNEDEDDPARFSLSKAYSYAELGKELKELKKKKKEGEGEEGLFTLSELQQRLAKLKEIELEREDERRAKGQSGIPLDLKNTLNQMRFSKDETPAQKLDILSAGSMISTRGVPQEHLIEKYFHPDNMSAAEKLKLELKKVRDEFKMSETDCGSARVQIAQLTTEIHHLSSVLHKKDKHSRRGLVGKVQRRKKLLKYLRRTDWDSYCFVITKLGLRDYPGYKIDYNKN